MRKQELYKIQKDITNVVQENMGVDSLVTVAVYPNGKKKKIRTPFVLVFQDSESYLVQILKPNTCKVLMFFRAMSEYKNRISKDISEITNHCGLCRRAIITAINELKEYNIIATNKSPEDKRRKIYYLNPMSSWKGHVEMRKELYGLFGTFEGSKECEKDLFALPKRESLLMRPTNTTPNAKQTNIE